MKVSGISANAYSNNVSYKSNTGKAALISAMLLAPSTSSQMPVEKDTFEKSAKTEYVTNPSDTLADDVYDLAANPVGNKERGEFFNKWFWQMVACANEDGSFNADKMNGASLYFRFPEKDYKQLAADIICTFDKNGDNKIDYYEYAKKSEQLVNEKAGKTLSADVIGQFHSNFFAPWFNGFDYDREKNEYNINEVAATLYALDCFSSTSTSGKGYICGDKLLYELGYVMDNGKPDICFEKNRIRYYNEYVIK
ncbi:hypothetical protein IJI31_05945 [bacterium]|nr:hypothetical protein [bacterium]